MTRNSRCFIPTLLVESPDVSKTRFNRFLDNMVSTRQLRESYAEELKEEFPKKFFQWSKKEEKISSNLMLLLNLAV